MFNSVDIVFYEAQMSIDGDTINKRNWEKSKSCIHSGVLHGPTLHEHYITNTEITHQNYKDCLLGRENSILAVKCHANNNNKNKNPGQGHRLRQKLF